MALYNSSGEKIPLDGETYNCQDYGVTPDNADNTSAMQALIDLVHENGGGTIWIPCGVYVFKSDVSTTSLSGNMTMLLNAKKRVSIVGESVERSVLKVTGNTSQGSSLFAHDDAIAGEVLVGATYSNFTVDMSEASLTTYSHKGKAFFYSGITDCVFRDLRLIGTPSTSLGIDMLDNVVMDSIYVYQGGRQWSIGGNGGAGIGIGTGQWENENYIIRNCICDDCGHFGIFLEDQGIFSATKARNYPKGQIIANNIVRNGRHYGIGVRGGKNVVITGNNLYENYGGIYMDYGAKNVMISNNLIQGSTEAGFLFGDEDAVQGANEGAGFPCENVVFSGNGVYENLFGVWKIIEPTTSQISNNALVGNVADEPVESDIDTSLGKNDVYINDNGVETANTGDWLYDSFIDLATTRVLYDGTIGIRVAEYDDNKNFIKRWYGDYAASVIAPKVSDTCRYIKIGSNAGDSGATMMASLKLYGV